MTFIEAFSLFAMLFITNVFSYFIGRAVEYDKQQKKQQRKRDPNEGRSTMLDKKWSIK